MSELTVGAGFAGGLVQFAAWKGADPAELMRRSGISADDLADHDNRIPFSKYVALMRTAKELCNDPALSLHYGEAVNVAQFSVVGLLGQASATMADAFVQLNRFVKLIVETDNEGSGERFKHVRIGKDVWLTDMRKAPNEFPELTEFAFAHMVYGTRQYGETPFVKEVHFTHAEPAHSAEYARVFGAPIVFSASHNAMRIDEAWLSYPIAVQPRFVFGILSEHAEELLKDLETSKTTRGRVESLLMPVLHTGEANVDAIAQKLGLSRQTLFRKLKAEGATFEKVLDDLRHRLAVDYLRGKRVSVTETAYLVGFSDPAAFSRAFKRWTGTSPSLVRGQAD